MLSLRWELNLTWLCNAALLFCVLLAADNDVDGQTLLRLTENMITHLLPTIRLQVQFSGLLTALKQQQSSPTPAPPASTLTPPSTDESHCSASNNNWTYTRLLLAYTWSTYSAFVHTSCLIDLSTITVLVFRCSKYQNCWSSWAPSLPPRQTSQIQQNWSFWQTQKDITSYFNKLTDTQL